jgi:hypothetical protein
VEAFLKQPLIDAGFKNLNFTEVWQIEAADLQPSNPSNPSNPDWRDY